MTVIFYSERNIDQLFISKYCRLNYSDGQLFFLNTLTRESVSMVISKYDAEILKNCLLFGMTEENAQKIFAKLGLNESVYDRLIDRFMIA